MKNKIILTVFFIFSSIGTSMGQWDYGFDFSKSGSAGLQFLKIGIGARENGMGGAAVCVSTGINGIFWNPAGIAHINGQQGTFSHANWLLGMNLEAAAVGFKLGNFAVIGISVISLGLVPFEETTVLEQGGTGRMVDAGDLAVGLTVARRFTNKLSMGMQIRFAREQLDMDSFSSILLDLGAIYDTGFRHLRIAVAAQHFGPDIKMLRDKFRMPLILKVGIADDLIHGNMNRLTLELDLLHPTDNSERLSIGIEYAFYERIFLRSGYRVNFDLGEWSVGAGIRQTLLGVDGSIDYSFTDFGEIFGGVHRISIAFGS